jgi:putative membrane protein
MNLLFRILITAVAAVIAAWILPGVTIDDFLVAIVLAFVLAILNGFLKPILIFLTIPITIFTFGLFLLVINAAIILLAGYFVNGFDVRNFWYALLFSLILSFISSLLGIDSTQRRPGRY